MNRYRELQAKALVEYIEKVEDYVTDIDRVFLSDMAEKVLDSGSFCLDEIKDLERIYCYATEKQLNKVV
jgi:hypothetical protein